MAEQGVLCVKSDAPRSYAFKHEGIENICVTGTLAYALVDDCDDEIVLRDVSVSCALPRDQGLRLETLQWKTKQGTCTVQGERLEWRVPCITNDNPRGRVRWQVPREAGFNDDVAAWLLPMASVFSRETRVSDRDDVVAQ